MLNLKNKWIISAPCDITTNYKKEINTYKKGTYIYVIIEGFINKNVLLRLSGCLNTLEMSISKFVSIRREVTL
jgi:hypothetical protein